MLRCGIFLGVAVLASWLVARSAAATPAPAEPPAEPPFASRLREIARTYFSYGEVDRTGRWAPTDCRAPTPPSPRLSASKDAETHGRKLYYLYASDRSAYLKLAETAPVGQVIVKESWLPEELAEAPKRLEPMTLTRTALVPVPVTPETNSRSQNPAFKEVTVTHFLNPYVQADGKYYKATKPNGLFVMFKTDPRTPDTDAGWVYGTLTADGKTVTAGGKIASCMRCHEEAKKDRLFGLSRPEAKAGN